MSGPTASVVTVGSELTEGLRVDTNTAEIAHALSGRGVRVVETVSVADDVDTLVATFARLTAVHDLVVVTGGLGPTHDDITREAASAALGRPLVRDERIARMLEPSLARHSDPEARSQILVQADVLEDAEVIDPVTGTAPGLVVPTPAGELVLLPGPPSEMRPMLAGLLPRYGGGRAAHGELGIAGMTGSDVQVVVQRAIEGIDGIGFTVLARPGDVRAIFTDEGGGAPALDVALRAAEGLLGDACYGRGEGGLGDAVVQRATRMHLTLAVAESCTGGMVATELTAVPGASACFAGGVVSYSNASKRDLLGVSSATLDAHGAVSAETVDEMARGARERFCADVAVAISGIAGPDGGTPDKPVGLVWFSVADRAGTVHEERRLPGDRRTVRLRATAIALDLMRRSMMSRSR